MVTPRQTMDCRLRNRARVQVSVRDGRGVVIEPVEEVDRNASRQSGAEVLAAYPHSLLVRATVDQRAALHRAGLQVAPLEQAPIRVSRASFELAEALAAEEAAPVPGEARELAHE